jgi:acetyl-CoA carboxylase carboxyltransferase component
VSAAYRREIEAAPDSEAKRAEIEERLNALRSPFRTAHSFAVEDIIDPRDTRALLVDFVEDAQEVIRTQLGPTSRIPYLP